MTPPLFYFRTSSPGGLNRPVPHRTIIASLRAPAGLVLVGGLVLGGKLMSIIPPEMRAPEPRRERAAGELILPAILLLSGIVAILLGCWVKFPAEKAVLYVVATLATVLADVPLLMLGLWLCNRVWGIGFGLFWASLLKATAIAVFTQAVVWTFVVLNFHWTGWLLAPVVAVFLLSHLFELNFVDALFASLTIGFAVLAVAAVLHFANIIDIPLAPDFPGFPRSPDLPPPFPTPKSPLPAEQP